MPNELVTGANGERPPVKLVRQSHDVLLLRLLCDLYCAQALREDGGVSRALTRERYDCVEVGRRAQFIVWGFCPRSYAVSWTPLTRCHYRQELTAEERTRAPARASTTSAVCRILVDLGLAEWVPQLVESAAPEGEIIHPLSRGGSGSLEDQLGHEAALSMLTEAQREWVEGEGLWLVPVPKHVAKVELIGTLRLLYRPQTRMTSAWWAELHQKGRRFLDDYRALTANEGAARQRTLAWDM